MAKYRGKASITLINATSARQLSALIVSDKQRQVTYNPNTGVYLPNLASTPATLTPELYVMGEVNNISSQVKATRWYYQENSSGTKIEIKSNTDTYELSSTQPRTLKIKKNIFTTLNSISFTVQMDFLDTNTSTGIVVTAQAVIDMLRVTNGLNGSNATSLSLLLPEGDTIRNGTGSVSIQTQLIEAGSIVSPDVLKWYKMKSGATDPIAGSGWEQIDATATDFVIGANKITVKASGVMGSLIIKAIATYNNISYTTTTTINDISDPLQGVIIGNQFFKNGQGANSYTYRMYQAGVEYDVNGTLGTYTWSLWDKDGIRIESFSKTGKTITVLATDINAKANISCEYSDK